MIALEQQPWHQGLLRLGGESCISQIDQTGIASFCEEVNLDWRLGLRSRLNRDRRSGDSHDLLRESVNSIMNFTFMTLPRKVLPSADLTSQIPECIMRQGFGKCVCTLNCLSEEFLLL